MSSRRQQAASALLAAGLTSPSTPDDQAAGAPRSGPRALPAAPPLFSLDTLVARATLAPKAARREAPWPEVATAPPVPRDTPTALILWLTVTHCACGTVTRSPNAHVMLRYATHAHSIHHERATLDLAAEWAALPRLTREHHTRVLFCETCFGGTPETP